MNPAAPGPGATAHAITARTRLLVLLGHPVEHSVSPAMHNAAIAAAGLDLVYVAADVAPDTLGTALDGLAALGALGANLTVPHKQAVAASCTSTTAEAAAVGAVNTVVFGPDGPHGDNTDVAGFAAGLPAGLGTGSAVVLGAGGAARAVVVALARDGWAVTVAARRPSVARELADLVEAPVTVVAVDDETALAVAVRDAGLVVNATPLGWHGEALPAPLHRLTPDQVAYDLNYADRPSPFLADAAERGAIVVDGLAMVVGQAAAAFRTWTGVEPDVTEMNAAARAARAAHRAGDEAGATATEVAGTSSGPPRKSGS